MAESAVIGEIADRITVIDKHVQVRKRAERSTYQQRLAPLTGRRDEPGDTGTENGLAYRIHRTIRHLAGNNGNSNAMTGATGASVTA